MEKSIELRKKEEAALLFSQKATEMTVNNETELIVANNFLTGVKSLIKEIRVGYDDIIDKAHKTWKVAIGKRDHYLKPAQEAVRIIDVKMGSYLAKREAKRREVEERARYAQEEAARKAREAEEERLKKIKEAEEAGNQEEAEKIAEEPTSIFIPEQVRVPAKVKLEGAHARVHWLYEIEDLDKIPRPFLKIDPVAINRYIQKHKEKSSIPGIRIFSRTSVASRG